MSTLIKMLPGDGLLPMMTIIIGILGLVGGLALATRKKYPDAPWLKVSSRPGSLGRLEDSATFLRDSMAILRVGWERYSKHGINYMLDTPEGPRYIVAPKYLDELVRAPDSHVSALAAANVVGEKSLSEHKYEADHSSR